VFTLIAQDYSHAQIAHSLSLKVGTVKTYVQRIKEKLELFTQDELKVAYGWMTTERRCFTRNHGDACPPECYPENGLGDKD
jgi:DNA-binding NarL/FixJ family response regulator